MKTILFLCTGNSCRSQMAEGLLRHLAGDRYDAVSAGRKPAGFVHGTAVEVMDELGIDISGQQSKSIDEFLPPLGDPPDVVISVCDAAAGACAQFPVPVERIAWSFEDPAHVQGTSGERRAVFRRVRDEIQAAIEAWLN